MLHNGKMPMSILAAVVALGMQVGCGSSHPHATVSRAEPLARTSHLALGVATDTGAVNEWHPWKNMSQVRLFENTIKVHADIVMWYVDWRQALNEEQLQQVAASGSIPEITWEPYDSHEYVRGRPQEQYTMAVVASGTYDSYIRSFARGLKNYGKPVLLRFAHEMNGNWYPWGTGVNTPGDYVAAWRHVHDIFTSVGVSNVKWVWAPLVGPIRWDLYPGSSYVDIVGFSGFNGAYMPGWGGWKSFATMYNHSITEATNKTGKPVQISETSSPYNQGDREKWVADMLGDLKLHLQVASVVWFNLVKEADWRVSPDLASVFVAGLTR